MNYHTRAAAVVVVVVVVDVVVAVTVAMEECATPFRRYYAG